MKAIAYTDIKKNIIHISAEYVTTRSPDDLGMIVHELTHIVQHYAKLKPADVWLQEGIADYIRHKYFENDIDKLSINLDQDSYRQGYKPAALFLDWLQQKDPNIIRDLNLECSQGRCGSNLFVQLCSADVDALWHQFSTDYKNPIQNLKPEGAQPTQSSTLSVTHTRTSIKRPWMGDGKPEVMAKVLINALTDFSNSL